MAMYKSIDNLKDIKIMFIYTLYAYVYKERENNTILFYFIISF